MFFDQEGFERVLFYGPRRQMVHRLPTHIEVKLSVWATTDSLLGRSIACRSNIGSLQQQIVPPVIFGDATVDLPN